MILVFLDEKIVYDGYYVMDTMDVICWGCGIACSHDSVIHLPLFGLVGLVGGGLVGLGSLPAWRQELTNNWF